MSLFDNSDMEIDNNKKKNNIGYDKESVLEASKKYFHGNEKLAKIWMDKYSLKKLASNFREDIYFELTPADMFNRISTEIARIEQKYENSLTQEDIYSLLDGFKYVIPQGGPMAGIGNDYQYLTLSNCFVIGHDELCDSYGGIFQTDQEQVQLMKRRGGVGHDLSSLRPKNAAVVNSARTSSGMVSFMERFSNSTQEVAQDGRRGALMLSVSVKHPDIEDFIDAKKLNNKITGANISVKVTNDFMKAVIDDCDYTQQYPVDAKKPSKIIKAKAKNIFNKLVDSNWHSGDPGILYWDTIIKESIPDCYADLGFKTVSTNPCGEIPLCAHDSCRLLAINLYSYVKNPFTSEAEFDFGLFKQHVGFATRIMDDIIDLELEKIDNILAKIKTDPEPTEVKRTEKNLWEKIRTKAEKGRRMGIGHIGLADTLAALGIKYSSQKGIDYAVEIQKTLTIEAYKTSIQLAKERGAFPIYDYKRELENPFINRIKEAAPEVISDLEQFGRRNIALLTIAPTGTTSMMGNTSNGIEPIYSILQVRKVSIVDINKYDTEKDKSIRKIGERWWKIYIDVHPKFDEWARINNIDYKQYLDFDKITDTQLTANQVITEIKIDNVEWDNLLASSPYYKSTALDLDYIFRTKMQGSVQKWVDHSISSTINLPENVEKDVIANAYIEAWKNGCKGITVFRDKCKSTVTKELNPRPDVLNCNVHTFDILEGDKIQKWIAFVGIKDQKPYEIFTGKFNENFFPGIFSKLDSEEFKHIDYNFEIVRTKDENQQDTAYVFNYTFSYKPGYLSDSYIPAGKIVISRMFNKEFWNYSILISHLLRQNTSISKILKTVNKLVFKENGVNWGTWKNGIKRTLGEYNKGEAAGLCPKCGEALIWQSGCTMGHKEGCPEGCD